MRRVLTAITSAPFLLVFVLSGCGGTAGRAPAQANVEIPFRSSAFVNNAIPSRYTCDGTDVSPPLEWGPVPAGVTELAVFALSFKKNPATHREQVAVDWAVSGLNPALHRLASGSLPAGAHVGRADDGKRHYSVCPAKGRKTSYQFAVMDIPPTIRVAPKFSGVALLKGIVNSRSATQVIPAGLFVASYTRK